MQRYSYFCPHIRFQSMLPTAHFSPQVASSSCHFICRSLQAKHCRASHRHHRILHPHPMYYLLFVSTACSSLELVVQIHANIIQIFTFQLPTPSTDHNFIILRTQTITMASTGDNLRSLIFNVEDGKASLSVLDQLLIPHETKYVPVKNVEDAWDGKAAHYMNLCLNTDSLLIVNDLTCHSPLPNQLSALCAFVELHSSPSSPSWDCQSI